GTANSSTGDGGTVAVYAGRNLTVTPGSLLAGPQGVNGAGANITLSAGSSTAAGNLFINAGLAADSTGGGGTGRGGTITLSCNSTTVFTINTGATTNGVAGIVSAAAAGIFGQGGTISVSNYGTGGITLSAAANAVVTAAFGAGGSLTLDA